MRNRSPSPEHAEAVSRRLATLSAELASVRGDPPGPAAVPSDHTRVRPDRLGPAPQPVDPAPVDPAPVEVPVPGRHAHRRRGLAGGAGPLRIAPAHLAVLALLMAVGLVVTAWLVVRSAAEPAALPSVQPADEALVGSTPAAATGPSGAGGTGGATGSGTADGSVGVSPTQGSAAGAGQEVTVDVAGKVRRPGIAVLPEGSRVVDALEAAGGARRGVDLTGLNLARPLVDGEQVLVGVQVPGAAGAAVDGGAPPGAGTTPLVDINTADQATLETLPGVGPVTAAAIIDWRSEHDGFTSVDELMEVDGIGEATLEDLAPHVTV